MENEITFHEPAWLQAILMKTTGHNFHFAYTISSESVKSLKTVTRWPLLRESLVAYPHYAVPGISSS